MAHLSIFSKTSRTRGFALLEILLALAVGTMLLIGANAGLNRKAQNDQVEIAGAQLKRIIAATETWTNDNYEAILNAAPRAYNVNQTQAQLNPYLGGGFTQDSFKNSYRLATRRYSYTVPDPATGGNTTRQALQVLVIGFNNQPNPLASEPILRINVANAAGAQAGFVSTNAGTCDNGAGNRMAPGNICGAFGAYALNANQFPNNSLANATILGLVSKGDSSFYGDQLYRYDYGDPDLNTMRTSLLMDAANGTPNEIQSPRRAITVRSSTTGGGDAALTIGRQSNNPADRGDIVIDPGTSNRVVVVGQGASPSIKSSTNVLMLGDRTTTSMTDSGGNTRSTNLGDDQVRANQFFSNLVGTNEVSSLWRRGDTPLRLQNFQRGEVIIGRRARYSPRNQGNNVPGLNYEISDGRLVAGHVVSQDITCADCGGSLSQILPKWRHMGTYFVAYTSGAGTQVPHPSCGGTRRNMQNRNATSDNQAYNETQQDTRYRPAILLVPRQILSKSVGESNFPGQSSGQWTDIPIDSHLRATQPTNPSGQNLPFWNVVLHKQSDNVYTTAFALTYCVFTGGAAGATDPTYATVPGMFEQSPAAGIGSWTVLP